MKKRIHIVSGFVLLQLLQSCCKDNTMSQSEVVGEVTVSMDANKIIVRTKESLIGNFVCDGIKSELDRRGETVDFVIMNGGGIRFSTAVHPNGIYPAGTYTEAVVDEILPFGNSNVIVKVSGRELKSIMERAVAQLPKAEGSFLQLSSQISISVDTTKPPQVINELVNPPVIVSPGSRITSIKINNVEYDTLKTYVLAAPDFLALQKINDGYVTFINISADKKEDLGDDQASVIKNYVRLNTPLTPALSGRIIYK